MFRICRNFARVDRHPDAIPDRVMSNVYEHLIRRFGAAVNEGAEDRIRRIANVHAAAETDGISRLRD